MAISRLVQTTLQNGFEKYTSLWDGRSAVGSVEAISAITLTDTQGSIEFNNIPSTYSHLQIRAIVRDNRSSNPDSFNIQFNSDTGANYSYHYLTGDGSAPDAAAAASANYIYAARFPGANQTANTFGVALIDVLDYANTNKYKTVRVSSGYDNNGSGLMRLDSGNWRSSSAITSVKITPNVGTLFSVYSSFSLYGVK